MSFVKLLKTTLSSKLPFAIIGDLEIIFALLVKISSVQRIIISYFLELLSHHK